MKQSVLLKNNEYHKIHSYLRSLFSQTFHILWLPALVLFVNIVFEAGGIYYALPLIDMPMHFAGGASIAVAGIAFLAFLRTRGFVSELPFLVRTLFIMSFVGLAAVSWELWEFSIDFVLERNLQRDLFDTMTDMFFGLLGGFITSMAWLCFSVVEIKSQQFNRF